MKRKILYLLFIIFVIIGLWLIVHEVPEEEFELVIMDSWTKDSTFYLVNDVIRVYPNTMIMPDWVAKHLKEENIFSLHSGVQVLSEGKVTWLLTNKGVQIRPAEPSFFYLPINPAVEAEKNYSFQKII